MKISIIVPTYNEVENIPVLVERTNKVLRGEEHEIIVVDDNSPDGTFELAQTLAEERVIAIKRTRKDGLATAVLEGLKYAQGETIVVMDADLQHPPEIIPRLVRALQEKEAEISIASRYVPGGGVEEEWSLLRRLVSRMSAQFARMLLPKLQGIQDPLSGFFACDRKILQNVELKPIGFKILAEILVRCTYQRVVEVPFIFASRKFGKSNLNLKEEINFLRHYVRLRFSKSRP